MSQFNPTASGVFTSKAEREALKITPTTSANVGPGIYTHDPQPSTSHAPALAPFHVSAARALMENNNMSAYTPGPGAYSPPPNQAVSGKSIPPPATTQFGSGTARLYEDKTRRHVPGPGAYPDENAWIKKSFQKDPSPEKAGAQAINRSHTAPAVPSIPTQHQCTGYLDSGAGNLVLQPPPVDMYTGIKADKVGPGRYEPNLQHIRADRKASNWSDSQTRRQRDYSTFTPGIGTYSGDPNPPPPPKPPRGPPGVVQTVTVNGMEVHVGGAYSSSFATKVLRLHQAKEATTPGPGDYGITGKGAKVTARKSGKKGATPPAAKPQSFGVTSLREGVTDLSASLHSASPWHNPGPGTYTDPRQAVVNPKPPAEYVPFSSTAERFVIPDPQSPDPRTYHPGIATDMAVLVSRRIDVSRSGQFLSSAPRFKSPSETKRVVNPNALTTELVCGTNSPPQTPGPGTYDFQMQSKALSGPPHPQGHSEFLSKTDRFKPPPVPRPSRSQAGFEPDLADLVQGEQTLRGSTAEQSMLPDGWTKRRGSSKNPPAFGFKESRTGIPIPVTIAPGPGAYADATDMRDAFKPFTNTSKAASFGNSVPRFKSYPHPNPGPGYYEAPGGLVKGTFNAMASVSEGTVI